MRFILVRFRRRDLGERRMDTRAGDSAGTSQLMVAALRLLFDGQQERGLALYSRALDDSPHGTTGVGIHLAMLEQAGQKDCANVIRSIALRKGADVRGATLRGRSSAEAADEYERLFARGHINAWMVSRYLILLDKLGRVSDLERLLDPARLVRQIRLAGPDPAGHCVSLAEALRCGVLEREQFAHHERAVQSVRDMFNLKSVHTIDAPAFQRLQDHVREEVMRVITEWIPVEHPISRWVPTAFDLEMWALTSRGPGFTTRHVHSRGWYTGVYYATGVDSGSGDGGVLRIGRPPDVAPDAPGWPDLTIRPEPGLLVLMPSYCTHWTEPLGQPGLRVSIAFDVTDTRS